MSIALGDLFFDLSTGGLSRAGKPIAIGSRGAALLSALAEADGEVVGKDALMAAGWPGTFVEEGNLSVQIATLRKAMGPRPDGQDWIATVPRVGYRLLKAAPAALPLEDPRPVRPSLAVLPFQNLSGDPEQDYFADGVVEDITTALSRFKSFAVIARNSSFVYKGRSVDVRVVAKELGVRYVLEGSVRRAGDRLRISAQLVDAAEGGHLWADHFDGQIQDVFDFQDHITERVASFVEPSITAAEIRRSRRERPDSLAAYDLYLRALPDVYAMRPEGNARAVELLEQAAAIEPDFALVHALTGTAYMARHAMQLAGANPDHDVRRAVSCAKAALATGTDAAYVLGTAGFVLLQIGHLYDEGFALLRRAVSENPNHVMVLTNMGIACLLGGDLDEGELCLERAMRLNPREMNAHWQLTGIAHIRMARGQYAEALDAARRSLAMSAGYDATYGQCLSGADGRGPGGGAEAQGNLAACLAGPHQARTAFTLSPPHRRADPGHASGGCAGGLET
jgi:TolB-like protein/Tfp pilus assembly protein PilF